VSGVQTAGQRENQRLREDLACRPPREEYFQELADIRSAGRKLTEEEWIEVWARHDQYPA
jgi:hypothetical protein